MQVGALPLWKLIFCGANRLLQQGARTRTDGALWTLWMLLRVNQLDNASQTFITNVLVDFGTTSPHEIAMASFQELMHAHS